jgi:hypothetical protein
MFMLIFPTYAALMSHCSHRVVSYSRRVLLQQLHGLAHRRLCYLLRCMVMCLGASDNLDCCHLQRHVLVGEPIEGHLGQARPLCLVVSNPSASLSHLHRCLLEPPQPREWKRPCVGTFGTKRTACGRLSHESWPGKPVGFGDGTCAAVAASLVEAK